MLLQELMVNLEIERQEGQRIRAGRSGPTQARQSRQRFEKTAELVIGLMKNLEVPEA